MALIGMRDTMRRVRKRGRVRKLDDTACVWSWTSLNFPSLLYYLWFHPTQKQYACVFRPVLSASPSVVFLFCCSTVARWPRLSDCTSISTEMENRNEMNKKAFSTQIHFPWAQNGMSQSVVLIKNVITLQGRREKKKGGRQKSKWPTSASGYIKLGIKVRVSKTILYTIKH